MRIISWNLWANNRNQIDSLQHVLRLKPHILCLQEATKQTVDYLQSLGEYHIQTGLDYRRTRGGKTTDFFLVIATKPPITDSGLIRVEHLTHKSLYDKLLGWDESFEFPYVDVSLGQNSFRLFNLHLECACGPNLRLRQLDSVLQHFAADQPNLICGDFNNFANPWINPFIGWLFNYFPNEYLKNEKRLFAKIFDQHKLQDVFAGRATYPKFQMQLDYILIPDNLAVQASQIFTKLHGSDHLALVVDIKI